MQFFSGVTSGFAKPEDGIDWYVRLSDGNHIALQSGDWLWIRDHSGELLFSGVFIRNRCFEFVSFEGARYSKMIASHQLGWDSSAWAKLFLRYEQSAQESVEQEPKEEAPAHATGYSIRVFRSSLLLWFYAWVEALLQFRLPQFSWKLRWFKGTTEAYFETGSEGVWWSVYEDGKQGYDGLNPLDSGTSPYFATQAR